MGHSVWLGVVGADAGFGLSYYRMDLRPAHSSVRDSSLGFISQHLCAPAFVFHQPANVPVVDVAAAPFLGACLVAADPGECSLGSNAQRVSKFSFADSVDDCGDGGFAKTR